MVALQVSPSFKLDVLALMRFVRLCPVGLDVLALRG